MIQFPRLFEPGKIGRMELRNRIVMPAIGMQCNDDEGFIRDHAVDYYAERAKGGVGLIITMVGSALRFAPSPGAVNLYDDRTIPGLRKVNDAVHAAGGRIAWQLGVRGKDIAQFLGKLPDGVVHEIGDRDKVKVISASAIPWVYNDTVPKEASRQEIEEIVAGFGEAARRVKESGSDAVEIQGGHGKLIGQFLSPRDNRRSDKYGGTAEKRARLACEVIRRVRLQVGPGFPIILRCNGSDFLPGGITLEDTLVQAPLFVAAGADAINVSASEFFSTEWQFPSYHSPDGPIVFLAEAIKKVVSVPVIAAGKIREPALAERILEEGKADFIALGRPMLADPHLPSKVKEGRWEDITHCIYCNNCLQLGNRPVSVKARGRTCAVNPALLRERTFQIVPATSPRKVMVVGGGVAGMEAARTLAERGHQVTLYEKSARLGGQWAIAAQQPDKQIFNTVLDRLVRGLNKAGVQVKFGFEVTADYVKSAHPDVVVVATGAVPAGLDAPGADGGNVTQAVDIITGKAQAGDTVVVVGGRYLGMEIAGYLAGLDRKVTLVTRRDLGRGVQDSIRRELRNELFSHRVLVLQNTVVDSITADGALVVFNHDLLFLKADTVVLAVGAKSQNRLALELTDAGVKVYTIGDCVAPRDGCDAIREGAEVGREI